MVDRLPRPQNIDKLDMWVDEAIWGHRMYDEQTPWLCFLEFLNVVKSEMEKERAFEEIDFNTLNYSPDQRLHLRNILFNNPRIRSVLSESNNNETQWDKWLNIITDNSAGLPTSDFTYLKNRFSSFAEFADVVDIIRSSAIEGDSNKRWSSKFVFPYGQDCLYEDLRVKGRGVSTDRRFFARTGELLYLMLCRSGKGPEILEYLKSLTLSKSNKWNRIVANFQPVGMETHTSRTGAYLPFEYLPEYRNLAEDWINLFDCSIPDYDILPHVVSITGIHLLIYFLNRAKDTLGLNESVRFIIEIPSHKKTVIRDLSAECYSENNDMPRRAIIEHIQRITKTKDWEEALESPDPVGVSIDILVKEFNWPDNDEISGAISEPKTLVTKLCNKAVTRNKQHVYKFHSTWGKEIGLSSRRGSRRNRYAPTDSLLKTLVLSTVPRRMEFQEFLQKLFEKYGFIIGDKQAQKLITSGQADLEAFSENALRFEHRLASIGLLKRLSDACAYVENPYVAEETI